MLHWLLHILGIDTQQSFYYDFWSGIGTQIAPMVLAVAWWHRNNCHSHRCLRLGKHSPDGTSYCTRHHPSKDTPDSSGVS